MIFYGERRFCIKYANVPELDLIEVRQCAFHWLMCLLTEKKWVFLVLTYSIRQGQHVSIVFKVIS